MTRSLFTMNVITVIVILHSVILIYANSIEEPTEKRPPTLSNTNCQPRNDVIVYEKDDVFTPCQAFGDNGENLTYNYWWTKDGQNISTKSTKYKKDDRCPWGLLLEPSKNMTIDGTYQCFVSNDNGITMSNPVTYREIAPFQSFRSTPRELNVTEGRPFSLNCTSTSPKAVNLEGNKWTRGKDRSETKLVENDLRITHDLKGNLWFSKIEISDSGSYIYKVTTQEGDKNFCETNLRVDPLPVGEKSEPIKIQKRFVSNETAEFAEWKKKKQLFCIYDGECDITWKKDGKPLDVPGNVTIGKSKKYIEIERFEIKDQGNYTCEVTDVDHNEVLANHTFTVKIGNPYIKTKPDSVDVIEGNQTEFHCEAYDNEAENGNAFVQWLYNTKPINESGFGEDLIVSEDRFTLSINKSLEKHIGNYGCKVVNSHGYAYEEASLFVAKKEECHCMNESLEREKELTEGELVNWTCPITGFPHPKIRWTKNNKPLENDTEGRIFFSEKNNKILIINKATSEDAGEYACIASCKGQNDTVIVFTLKSLHHANPSLKIILWVIVIIIIAIIVLAILLICKKRGYAHRIYDLRKRERQAENQRDPRTPEQSEVSLLAGGSARTATLNLKRKNTQNGISLAEVECQA